MTQYDEKQRRLSVIVPTEKMTQTQLSIAMLHTAICVCMSVAECVRVLEGHP